MLSARSNLQRAPKKAEILWEVHTIWQDIKWCQQCTRTWVQTRHQVSTAAHIRISNNTMLPIPNKKFYECNSKVWPNASSSFCEMTQCDLMSCSMADVCRCFVRWPCAMWCNAVWQMYIDVLWENAAGWKLLTVQDSSLLYCPHYIFSNTSVRTSQLSQPLRLRN